MKNKLIPTALAFSLCSIVGAHAQDNLEETMQGNIDLLAEEGGEITYSSSEVGDNGAITYKDFVLNGDEEVRISTDWVTVTPASTPGSVVVTTAPVITMQVSDYDPELNYELEITHENFTFETNLLHGAFGRPSVDIAADMLRFNGLTEDHPIMKDLDITQTGFTGSFHMDPNAQTVDGGWKADTVSGGYGFESEPEQLQAATFEYDGIGVEFDVTGFNPDAEFDEFLNAGGTIDAKFNSGAGKSDTTMMTPEFSAQIVGEGGASEGFLLIEDGDLSFSTIASGASYNVTPLSPGLPIPPFDASVGDVEFALDMPLLASEDDRDAKIVYSILDLEVSESLWSMIDPEATLPRDAANLDIRLNAELVLNESVPDLANNGPSGNPFAAATIDNVTIEAAQIDFAGAEITAEGGVEMDNSGPFPMPLGEVNVEVNGVQTLSQKLVDLGLLDQVQSGMAIGMMMAFGVPGDQPDQFLSKIEFKSEGIFANGQPIQ